MIHILIYQLGSLARVVSLWSSSAGDGWRLLLLESLFWLFSMGQGGVCYVLPCHLFLFGLFSWNVTPMKILPLFQQVQEQGCVFICWLISNFDYSFRCYNLDWRRSTWRFVICRWYTLYGPSWCSALVWVASHICPLPIVWHTSPYCYWWQHA